MKVVGPLVEANADKDEAAEDGTAPMFSEK